MMFDLSKNNKIEKLAEENQKLKNEQQDFSKKMKEEMKKENLTKKINVNNELIIENRYIVQKILS